MDDAQYDLEDEQAGQSTKRPGLPVEPQRLMRILASERTVLARTFIGVALIALVASWFVPERFVSGGTLLHEGSPLLDGGGGAPAPFVQAAMSSGQLRRIRERLGWETSLNGIRARLSVGMEDKSSMSIVAAGSTAAEAQALAQTTLDVFLERQIEHNTQRLQKLKIETGRSLERAIERRAEVAAQVDAFRDKSGKTHLLDDQTRLLERIAKLRERADAASVEIAAQQARIDELEKARRELPKQIMASATVAKSVDAPLAKARAELATARATLSGRHPRVQALQERVKNLEQQRGGQQIERGEQTMVSNPAREAVEQDLATTRAAFAAAQERQAALQVLIDSVRQEADELAPAEGEAREIATALKVADERLEALQQRASQIQDASAAPITGFRVLSVPPLPEEAERSGRTLLILGLLPLLITLALALALIIRRLRTLAIESPRELAWWGRGPVLGTSAWPREPDALEAFVDELEDLGMHGAGRTLVVPASETEREVACAFAMRLSEAPWLAAAVLDVDAPAGAGHAVPLVTPPSSAHAPKITPPATERRLSSDGVSASAPSPESKSARRRPPARPTIQGFVPPEVESEPPSKKSDPADKWSSAPPPSERTPLPPPIESKKSSSRPPRKKTIVGLPAVRGGHVSTADARPDSSAPRAVRGVARATVRMVVPPGALHRASANEATASPNDDQPFLLTRPVAMSEPKSLPPPGGGESDAPASHAVMRAAMRLLGDQDEDTESLRRSYPPASSVSGAPAAVALAWNGPLSGPVLRRAARLAHRVLIVVSSGMNAVELTKVTTRLGRTDGVGYVLVNLDDNYLDLVDRVGDVEAFWTAASKGDRRPFPRA